METSCSAPPLSASTPPTQGPCWGEGRGGGSNVHGTSFGQKKLILQLLFQLTFPVLSTTLSGDGEVFDLLCTPPLRIHCELPGACLKGPNLLTGEGNCQQPWSKSCCNSLRGEPQPFRGSVKTDPGPWPTPYSYPPHRLDLWFYATSENFLSNIHALKWVLAYCGVDYTSYLEELIVQWRPNHRPIILRK